MTETLFETADPVSLDSLSVELDGERLLVRSTVDNRERLLVLARGREDGLRLARALLAALEQEAA